LAIFATVSAAKAQSGTIYFSRDTTFISAAVHINVSIDDKHAGSVNNGECLKLKVPAGKRVLTSPSFIFGVVRERVPVTVPSGGSVYVKLVPQMDLPGPVHYTVMVVTKSGRRC
jgi:hypothetical protein